MPTTTPDGSSTNSLDKTLAKQGEELTDLRECELPPGPGLDFHFEDQRMADGPGRPILYSTTPEFLQHFGLNSILEMPPLAKAEDEEQETGDLLKG